MSDEIVRQVIRRLELEVRGGPATDVTVDRQPGKLSVSMTHRSFSISLEDMEALKKITGASEVIVSFVKESEGEGESVPSSCHVSMTGHFLKP